MPTDAAPLSISALTARIKELLEARFPDLWVEGEISNLRMQSSGHAYFTLKDARSQVPAALFAPQLGRLTFRPADGQKVRVRGELSVYPPRGAYQLIVRQMEPAGAGDLMARFEELKRRLQAEGLFDPRRKRPLPLLPRTVGIVTSPTGAAIRDMLSVTRRRFAGLRILIAPVRVQGEGAAQEIVAAIQRLNALPDADRPDVLIVGRGGGSIEDLWCFNEETVARALAASAIPTLSAVGHETDFTIADFVADLRAPTPSAAAEVVIGRQDDFLEALRTLRQTLARELRHGLEQRASRLDRVRSHRAFQQPQTLVRHYAQRVDQFELQLQAALRQATHTVRRRLDGFTPRLRIALTRRSGRDARRLAEVVSRTRHALAMRRSQSAQTLQGLRRQLDALSPLAVLERGYSVTRAPDGSILRSAAALQPGDVLQTRLARGSIESTFTRPREPSAPTDTARDPDAPQPPIPTPATPPPARRRSGSKASSPDDDTQLTLF